MFVISGMAGPLRAVHPPCFMMHGIKFMLVQICFANDWPVSNSIIAVAVITRGLDVLLSGLSR